MPDGDTLDVNRDLDTPHRMLRRETRAWHESVELAFDRFDLGRPEGLDGFVLAQASAILSLEDALDAAGVQRLLPDWPDRRRGSALAADLAERGLVPSGVLAPKFANPGRMLGAVYVLEGSRLGGRVLARRIDACHGGRHPRFLSHDPGPGAWPRFLAVLDTADCPSVDLLAGANEAFVVFHEAAACSENEAGVALVTDKLA